MATATYQTIPVDDLVTAPKPKSHHRNKVAVVAILCLAGALRKTTPFRAP